MMWVTSPLSSVVAFRDVRISVWLSKNFLIAIEVFEMLKAAEFGFQTLLCVWAVECSFPLCAPCFTDVVFGRGMCFTLIGIVAGP